MKRKIKPAAWNFPGRPAGARKEAGYQLAVRRDAEKAQRVARAEGVSSGGNTTRAQYMSRKK